MQITYLQVAAGRCLLGLTVKEIIEPLGISPNAYYTYEREGKKISKEKIETIKAFLINRGIEFVGTRGVALQEQNSRTYTGIDGFRLFMDTVYETARDMGGEIFLFNSKPVLWIEYLGKDWYDMHANRMSEISANFNFRIIVPDTNEEQILGLAEQRTLPIQWTNNIIYGYGNKIGFLDFDKNEITIKVIIDEDIKHNIENMFDATWQKALEIAH